MVTDVMESVAASWGKRIAARRKVLGFTQQRLADLCGGVVQATISKIERGDLVPGNELKWKLAAALQLSLEELFAYPAIVPPFPEQLSAEPASADELDAVEAS